MILKKSSIMEKKRNHYYKRLTNQHLLSSSHPDVQRHQMQWDWRQFCVKLSMHEIYSSKSSWYAFRHHHPRCHTWTHIITNVSEREIIFENNVNRYGSFLSNSMQFHFNLSSCLELNLVRRNSMILFHNFIHFNESIWFDRKTIIFHGPRRDIHKTIKCKYFEIFEDILFNTLCLIWNTYTWLNTLQI